MEQSLQTSSPPRQADYRGKVKVFKNGRIEASLSPVKPLKSDAAHAACNYPAAWRPLRVGTAQTPEELQQVREENHNRASRRAKTTIRHNAMAFDADRLLTLTVRQGQCFAQCVPYELPVLTRQQFYECWTAFVRMVRKVYPQFVYLAVPELHESGAYHFHVAIRGWVKISVLRRLWYKALGGNGDEKDIAAPGAVNIRGPKGAKALHRTWSTTSLSGYIAKYISKTFSDSKKGQKRYFRASNIGKLPDTRQFWVSGETLSEAMLEFVSILQRKHGLQSNDWNMWLSPASDFFWLNTRIPEELVPWASFSITPSQQQRMTTGSASRIAFPPNSEIRCPWKKSESYAKKPDSPKAMSAIPSMSRTKMKSSSSRTCSISAPFQRSALTKP